MDIGPEEDPIFVPEPDVPDTVPDDFPEHAPTEPDPSPAPREPVPVGPSQDN